MSIEETTKNPLWSEENETMKDHQKVKIDDCTDEKENNIELQSLKSSDSRSSSRPSTTPSTCGLQQRPRISIYLVSFLSAILIIGLVVGLLRMRGVFGSRSSNNVFFSSAEGATQAILFVGDSFTYTNDGVNAHMKLLAASSTHSPRILACDSATEGGQMLERLWLDQFIHDTIHSGHIPDQHMKYNYVVLQDDIPEYSGHNLDAFPRMVRQFHEEIQGVGAQTVLFMAWAYERLPWVTMDQIALAHREIGNELGIPVAPVGLAMRRSLQLRPSMAMLVEDFEHESLNGTYLAATVIYLTIYGGNATDCQYVPTGMSGDDAAYLRGVALSAVESWNSGSNA